MNNYIDENRNLAIDKMIETLQKFLKVEEQEDVFRFSDINSADIYFMIGFLQGCKQ